MSLISVFETGFSNYTNEWWSCIAILLFAWLASLISLVWLRQLLSTELEYFRSNQTMQKYKLIDSHSYHSTNILLNIIPAIIFASLFVNAPLASTITYILVNLFVMIVYKNSTDFLLNLPLAMYHGYVVTWAFENEKKHGWTVDGKIAVFVKTDRISELSDDDINIAYLQPVGTKPKLLAIVK